MAAKSILDILKRRGKRRGKNWVQQSLDIGLLSNCRLVVQYGQNQEVHKAEFFQAQTELNVE